MNRTCKLFALLILIIPLLLGCGIGKTKTLFVTKTNAGLELSTTPPTIALDIGRVEGVLAPQFENGKKLPVMASFKFETSGAFSPNVGSAFATGDAAITMAALYGDDTPEPNWKSRLTTVKDPTSGTNSVLNLNGEPNPGRWLPLPDTKWLNWMNPELRYQKNDVRPVFFGTDTSLGVKVAWSGMTGQFPDTARFGYNRKELALVPISMEENIQATQGGGRKKSYDMKMSSLLATLDSGVEVDGTPALDSAYIQYFATGNAATLLSLQRDVRAAMLQRLDPNSKLYQAQFGEDLKPEGKAILTRVLQGVYDGLIMLSNPQSGDPDLIAKKHVEQLDKVARDVSIPMNLKDKGLIYYLYTKKIKELEKKTSHDIKSKSRTVDSFSRLMGYWSLLRLVPYQIRTVSADIEKGEKIKFVSDTKNVEFSESEKQLMATQLLLYEAAYEELDKKIRTNSDVVGAYQYLQAVIKPK